MRKLLEYGPRINASNGEQLVPLHSAARVGDLQTVQLLVEQNAKLNALDSLQRTPVYLAAMNDHKDVVQYLSDELDYIYICFEMSPGYILRPLL